MKMTKEKMQELEEQGKKAVLKMYEAKYGKNPQNPYKLKEKPTEPETNQSQENRPE